MTGISDNRNQKIIMRLKGGLGNQLFIYSFGLFLKKKLKAELSFDYISGYINNKYKHLQTTKPLLDLFFDSIRYEKLVEQPYLFLARKSMTPNLEYINEDHQNLNNFSFVKSKNYYLEGYFQNFKYVEPFIESFRESIVKLQNQVIENFKNTVKINNSVGFHVRVNDYGVETNIEYLNNAYNFFTEKKIEIIYLFTDNIDWCTKNLSFFKSVKVINTGSDLDDFLLLSILENHSLTIGTYGWWAAIIKQKGLTVASQKMRTEFPNMYPKSWIYI